MGTHVASYAGSTSSPSYAPSNSKRMSAYPKSDIKVNLKDHYAAKVYTSSSPVTGDVTITTKRDVRFDSVQILLLGHTKTSFEGVSVPQEVTHTFLKMVMPIPESTYPVPRILESGQTYTIPFNFVIPNQLTINACNHARLSDQMQDHHVLLPPALGSGAWQRDDMAPKMARVEYTIKARVLRDDGPRKTRIMEATQPLQVLPATPEQPPLNITDKDRLYRLSKTKTLRKNLLLSTKLGRLTAEAAQPNPAVLSADARRVMGHPMARVKLTFDPATSRNGNTLPPTVTGVTAKLTAHTYFSSGTIESFPNLGEWNAPHLTDRRGQFSTSVQLPAVTLAQQPAWTPVSPPPINRRDSGYGSDAHQEPEIVVADENGKEGGSKVHTAMLDIPLALPTDKKTLVPTFHSCIASRVYTVSLSVGLAMKGSSAGSVSLTVPLQVVVAPEQLVGEMDGAGQGGPAVVASPLSAPEYGSDAGGPPSFEEIAADEHLRPRVLRALGEGEGVEAEGRGEWMWAQQQQLEADRGGLPEYGELGYRRAD